MINEIYLENRENLDNCEKARESRETRKIGINFLLNRAKKQNSKF